MTWQTKLELSIDTSKFSNNGIMIGDLNFFQEQLKYRSQWSSNIAWVIELINELTNGDILGYDPSTQQGSDTTNPTLNYALELITLAQTSHELSSILRNQTNEILNHCNLITLSALDEVHNVCGNVQEVKNKLHNAIWKNNARNISIWSWSFDLVHIWHYEFLKQLVLTHNKIFWEEPWVILLTKDSDTMLDAKRKRNLKNAWYPNIENPFDSKQDLLRLQTVVNHLKKAWTIHDNTTIIITQLPEEIKFGEAKKELQKYFWDHDILWSIAKTYWSNSLKDEKQVFDNDFSARHLSYLLNLLEEITKSFGEDTFNIQRTISNRDYYWPCIRYLMSVLEQSLTNKNVNTFVRHTKTFHCMDSLQVLKLLMKELMKDI